MINEHDIKAFKEILEASKVKVSETRTHISDASTTARPEPGSLRGAPEGQQFAGMNKGGPPIPPCAGHDFNKGEPEWIILRIKQALATYERVRQEIGGCHDRFCIITGKRTGMVTNGGCGCSKRAAAIQKLAFYTENFRENMANIVKDFET